jgi:hypothetical protein
MFTRGEEWGRGRKRRVEEEGGIRGKRKKEKENA